MSQTYFSLERFLSLNHNGQLADNLRECKKNLLLKTQARVTTEAQL